MCKDLTYLTDPASQSLLKAFLKALYTESYISTCEQDFGFVRITGPLRDKALEAIDALITMGGVCGRGAAFLDPKLRDRPLFGVIGED